LDVHVRRKELPDTLVQPMQAPTCTTFAQDGVVKRVLLPLDHMLYSSSLWVSQVRTVDTAEEIFWSAFFVTMAKGALEPARRMVIS
jgi:hypothetical protein